MNKTKIDWATMSWNPVTGCRHGCPYCYARRTATRFNAGLEDPASFWSMEPLLGPVDMAAAEGLPEWVILGAETGNRPDKVTPARKWVDDIVAFCEENEIPVFFKNNLREHFPDLPASAFPWEV